MFKFKEKKEVEIVNFCKNLNFNENHNTENHHLFLGNCKSETDPSLMNRIRWSRDKIMEKMSV